MGISLSHKLNLRLNDYPIVLKKPLDGEELGRHGIKKAGFLARLMLKPAKGETIFWAKNCTLQYLDRNPSNAIAPVVDKAAAPELRFSTTAFFHYTGPILSGFAFQITNESASASRVLGEFEQKVTARIGQAASTEPLFKTWEDGGQRLMVDFPESKRHGYIHLMLAE